MGMVKGITFYVGPDLARPLQPPENLMLKDDGVALSEVSSGSLEQ